MNGWGRLSNVGRGSTKTTLAVEVLDCPDQLFLPGHRGKIGLTAHLRSNFSLRLKFESPDTLKKFPECKSCRFLKNCVFLWFYGTIHKEACPLRKIVPHVRESDARFCAG